jgi:hypothetical protein
MSRPFNEIQQWKYQEAPTGKTPSDKMVIAPIGRRQHFLPRWHVEPSGTVEMVVHAFTRK